MAGKLRGLSGVMANINKEIKKIEGRAVGGLFKAGLIVEDEAKKRVPVEFGWLRGSGYTRKAQNNPLAVHVGFQQAYAIFVHEAPGTYKGLNKPRPAKKGRKSGIGVYWGPKGEPRFLANSLNDKKAEILKAVVDSARKTT